MGYREGNAVYLYLNCVKNTLNDGEDIYSLLYFQTYLARLCRVADKTTSSQQQVEAESATRGMNYFSSSFF